MNCIQGLIWSGDLGQFMDLAIELIFKSAMSDDWLPAIYN